MNYGIKKEFILFLIVFFLVVFYPIIGKTNFHIMKFIDELIAFALLLFFFLYLFKNFKIKLFREEYIILICFFFILLFGTISVILFKKNTMFNALSDFIVFSKFIFAYFGARYFFRNFDLIKKGRKIYIIWKYLAVIILILTLINLFFNLFPVSGRRFGIDSQLLFFNHPSRFAFFFIFSFVIMLPTLYFKNKKLLVLILIAGLFSMRYKYFVFFVLASILLLFIKKIRRLNIFNFRLIFILLLFISVSIFITLPQIKNYIKYGSQAARNALYITSFKIANDYFPLGTGFGTFASYFSAARGYSKVYLDYNLANIKGLTPDNYNFVADTYWPMVLGQFGWIGLICMLIIIFLFLRIFIKIYNSSVNFQEKLLYFSGILLILSLLIDSTADAIFSQNRAVASFIYLAVIVNTFLSRRKYENIID